jgi:outer membrane protein OmpA-like peptidoglycan-associated protein/opacity protein-like surface antigen
MGIQIRKLFLISFSLLFTVCSFAQDSTFQATVPPFTGSKAFRKLSFGIHAGLLAPAVVTGGPNDFTKPKYDLGYGANIRYQISHLFGLELNGLRGHLHGTQEKNWGNGQPPNVSVSSFKTEINALGTLNGVITLGNINWISVKNTIVPYLTLGGGLASYSVKIVPKGSTNEIVYKDGIHEGVVNWGAGAKINLNSLLNLDLGYKAYYVDGDNLDGTRLTPRHYDKFGYGFVGLEFSLGNKNKPKLLFNNPAAALQSGVMTEIDKLKAMIPSDVDSDHDGVPDRTDMEPNTPAGCPGDVRGVSIDTDGDGVPDCRDKEKITPTQCQPVNADGVGKCPDPECCKNMATTQESTCATSLGSLPAINFSGNAATLSTDAQGLLASVAGRLRNSPNCHLTIVGYCVSPKATQAKGVARVDAVINYFVEKEGISRDRLTTLYGQQGGDCSTVDLRVE